MKDSEALQRSYNTVRTKWDPHFEWVVNDSSPWTAVASPVAQSAVALVSTCGAFRRSVDLPFDAGNYF